MTNDNGGPAFPVPLNPGERYQEHAPQDGMTLRDYFAAKELSKIYTVECCDIPDAYARQAEHCYRMADAMLKERERMIETS